MRFRPNSELYAVCRGRQSGYTLVEILVATTLTLILMTAVVTVFGGVGDGISKSRRALEQFDRLRTAVQQLRMDLQGLTVTLDGRPARPEESPGYFEVIEGGILNNPQAINSVTNQPDLTVGERGDILMFTTRSAARPFVGRYSLNVDPSNPTLQSDVAEVAWFLRGTTLHRRVLLVVPGVNSKLSTAGIPPSQFFANNDISVRLVNGKLVGNSLGDLTKRENRFAHPANAFPFDARAWGFLGLPTLAECSSPSWMGKWINGTTPPPSAPATPAQLDYWDNAKLAAAFGLSSGTATPDQALAQDGTRLADDVVLTNVIGFDVKVWEPAPNPQNGNMPGYVDLGYGGAAPVQLKNYVFPQGPTTQRFHHLGVYAFSPQYSLVADGTPAYRQARVYDSGCFSYENEGIYHFDQRGNIVQPVDVPGGKSTNGMDDNGDGVVDDLGEWITSSPYPVPLRGIQIKVRCFEPDSRQVREITIEQDFLPK